MAPIEQRLITLRRAVLACRETPGRRGRLVELQDAEDVVIGGDLHGHVENFRRLLLRADLANYPRRHLVVQELVHGPHRYPGGGDRSHQLIDLVCALKVQYPHRVHYLVGNHELAQLTNRRVGKMDEGDLNELFLSGVREAYGNRADEVYAVYRALWGVAPLAVRTEGRLFISHSLPGVPDWPPAALEREPTPDADLVPGGAVYALVWHRDTSHEASAAFLAHVHADYLVTGHIPFDEGFARPTDRHLILDSKGHPACCAVLPAERLITPEDFAGCVHFL